MASGRTIVERTEQKSFFSRKTKGHPYDKEEEEDEDEEPKEIKERERERKKVRTSESEGERDSVTKSPQQMMKSKFRKNPNKKKKSQSKSKLKKKLINVWKREPSGKNKESEGENTDDIVESEEEEEGKSRKKTKESSRDKLTRRHPPPQSATTGEDKSSNDEKDPLPSSHTRTKNMTDGEEEEEEDTNVDTVVERKKDNVRRGRHFSGTSRDGDRTDVTSVVSGQGLEGEEEEEEEGEQEKTSSKIILADESFHMARHGLTDPNLWNVVSFEPVVHSTDLDWETWANMTYYPSSSELSLTDKLPDDLSVRFLEDEGIFVGNPIQISTRNTRRLEHRILTENSLEWLGQNGKLLSFPDPYRPERIQLHHDEMSTELMNSVSFKLAKAEMMQEFPLDPKTSFEIIVDIGSIHFKHHSLFSTENVLAAKLETYFEEHNRRKESKSTERVENKLKALRVALQHCHEARVNSVQKYRNLKGTRSNETENIQEAISQFDERIKRIRQDMSKTRSERNQLWKEDKSILTSVLDSWKKLKNLRHHQEYTSTPVKLNIITTHEDFEIDKQVWTAEIDEEFEDVREEYEEEYNLKLTRYRSQMKDWTEMRRRRKEKRRRKAGKTKDDGDHAEEDEDDEEDKENRGGSRNTRHEDTENNDSDNSDSSAPSLSSKPMPPSKFDADMAKNEILSLFQDLKRLPGEPKISLELVNTGNVTTKTAMPPNSVREVQRRKMMEKTQIQFKILFNGQDAYTSPPREFSPDFSVFFDLTIPIKIRERPEALKMIIFETVKTSQTILSELQMSLPNRKTSIERCYMQKMEFKSELTIKTSHAGVGSGISFSTHKEDYDGIFTHGYTTVRIGWTADKDGNILCPPGFEKSDEKDDVDIVGLNTRELFESGDIHKLSQNIQLDPNDPRNSKWIDTLAKKMQRAQRRRSLGLLDDEVGDSLLGDDDSRPDIGEFEFCTMDDIDNSARFRLLKLRDEETPEFKNLRMIPAHDRDIPSKIFEEYERRLKDDAKRKAGDKTGTKVRRRMVDDDGDYDLNRLERIREIRIKVLRLFESSLKQITFDDVIVEEQIPDIGTLGLNIMTLFQPRRPLRPTRRERKRVQGSSLTDTKLTLIVNIVRAFNLPMRRDTEVGLLTTESVTGIPLTKKRTGSTLSSYSTPKPFVEIWFQRNVSRTTTALGANPTWNQESVLNLNVPDDDYSQDNLSKMDDLVYLLIYDEVAIDLLEDDRRRDTDIHQRLEKRWLGSITIPFSTLFTNGRIEGTFRINSPTILLGYEAQGMATNFMNSLPNRSSNLGSRTNMKERFNTTTGSQVNNQKNAFITLFMTLQPAISRILTFKEESATGEPNEIRSHVKSWKMFLTKKWPNRNIKPFVMNVEGETILCTRYLKAIPPPEVLINRDAELLKNMEDIAHFVSLFPSVRDSTLGIADYSLWVTSDVFVGTPGGGIEDHAVLLACFFMHMQVQCWIVQGNAIPDGPTAYVVTTFKGHTEHKIAKYLKNANLIWNPCTGEYYFANDNFCPLQKVWTVVGSSNMWANVSENERPHQIDWDFTKTNFWKPLFSKQMDESKIATVQLTDIKFKAADQVQANSLSQRLERHLKDAFMKWRKTSKTKWNRYCTAILRRLLPRLEEIKSGKSRTQPRAADDGSTVADSVHSIVSETPSNFSEEHLMELRDVMATYQMTGFPLQQAYVNMESVTESVFATGVHTIDTPHVEFSIAAYARSYPAGLYSTWIYIAALHRRK